MQKHVLQPSELTLQLLYRLKILYFRFQFLSLTWHISKKRKIKAISDLLKSCLTKSEEWHLPSSFHSSCMATLEKVKQAFSIGPGNPSIPAWTSHIRWAELNCFHLTVLEVAGPIVTADSNFFREIKECPKQCLLQKQVAFLSRQDGRRTQKENPKLPDCKEGSEEKPPGLLHSDPLRMVQGRQDKKDWKRFLKYYFCL